MQLFPLCYYFISNVDVNKNNLVIFIFVISVGFFWGGQGVALNYKPLLLPFRSIWTDLGWRMIAAELTEMHSKQVTKVRPKPHTRGL